MTRPPGPMRSVALVAGLTAAFGATVAVSWLAFGGTAAYRGPIRALEDGWPLIYGGQAVFAAVVGVLVARPLVSAFGRRGAALAIGAGWVGEWFVLLVGGTLFANELVPGVAWFYWIIGTGGPLQPVAALAGLWLASRGRRPPQAPMAEARSIRPS